MRLATGSSRIRNHRQATTTVSECAGTGTAVATASGSATMLRGIHPPCTLRAPPLGYGGHLRSRTVTIETSDRTPRHVDRDVQAACRRGQ